jgi:formate-dependent nitrite reductase membrane component NrfD
MHTETIATVTVKAPPWHAWVTADLFFNSLSSGTFAISAVCTLFAPAIYTPISRAGYLAAFPLVIIDLICLVADLGDPSRFHHMLRVFKPRSPMSVGVWSTSAFAFFAFAEWILTIVDAPALAPAQTVFAVLGLIAALIVGSYKGVLLSTTAQPGWKDARWLGVALSTSSGAMGVAFLIVACAPHAPSPAFAGLRELLAVLLVVAAIPTAIACYEMSGALARCFTRGELTIAYALSIGAGLVLPFILIVASSSVSAAMTAAALTMLGAIAFRHHLVSIPHRLEAP